MRIEDRVREAMRERADQVRSVPDRWSEIEHGPEKPSRRLSGRRAVAIAVAFAVFAASAFLVWSAFRPSEHRSAAGDGIANYEFRDVRVEGPTIDPRTGDAKEGTVDVSFWATWSQDGLFPGVHTCIWTVYDRAGSVIGQKTDEVLAMSPDNARATEPVGVRGGAAEADTATATCDEMRLDIVFAYQVTDASVLALLGSTATVRWDVRWPETVREGDWPTPNDCTVTVHDPVGASLASFTTSVVPGPTLPTTFRTEVPLGDAAADLSQAERDALTASVACAPFTGERAAVTSESPQTGSVNAEGLCGGAPATIIAEQGMVEVTGTPGNDRVILPEGVRYRTGGGVDLLCRPDGTVEATVVPEGITVSVYNASDEPGLAAALADQLDTQGFEIGDVNVSVGPPMSSSVVYFRTPEAQPIAEYVASLMTEAHAKAAPPDLEVPDRTAGVVVMIARPPDR